MKFIIVDNDEINLTVTSQLVSKVVRTNKVYTYQNASDALRFLQTYDSSETLSLFLDLHMPVVSGWDFLEFFTEFDDNLKSRVHIYILSSSVDPRDKTRALAHSNVISFVSKPITAAYLNDIFKNASEEL